MRFPTVTALVISLKETRLAPVGVMEMRPGAPVRLAFKFAIPSIAATRSPIVAVAPRLMSRNSTTVPLVSVTPTRKLPVQTGGSRRREGACAGHRIHTRIGRPLIVDGVDLVMQLGDQLLHLRMQAGQQFVPHGDQPGETAAANFRRYIDAVEVDAIDRAARQGDQRIHP